MILEQLQAIKRFGSSKESNITLKDIEEKEQELGIKIPTALKEFYLTFSEDDPIFSSNHTIFPLSKLSVIQSVEHKLVSFLSAQSGSKELYQLGFIPGLGSEDDPYYAQYDFLKGSDGSRRVLFPRIEKAPLSSGLLFTLGWQRYYTKPNSVITNSSMFSRANVKELSQKFKLITGEHPDEFFAKYGFIGYNEELSLWMVGGLLGNTFITIPDPEAADKYMSELGIEEYKWSRRNGEPVSIRPPVKKRPLYSLQPIIDLVHSFIGTEQQMLHGSSKTEVEDTQQHLETTFPAPLLECYLQASLQLRTGPDRFLALQDLEADKDKKIKFLVGNQGEPQFAFKADSPVVYRFNEWKQTWDEYCLIDGFLASELFWNALNQEKLGVVLTEFPECTKRVFGAKGKLGRFLSPVGKELTKGCSRFLFASPDHKILALYDDELKTAYLAAVGEAALKQLEMDAKVSLSWL